ncbi:MAG: DUF3047 domain-containing protein [Thermodesulfobacteriota bacterium]|nr:DUF3047 domain-containing protein [Thermodesulfobacteriota bacterium]
MNPGTLLTTGGGVFIVVFFLFSNISLASEQMVVGNFSDQSQNNGYPNHWESLLFDGVDKHTIYTHVFDGDIGSIQATSRAGASGLVRKMNIDPSLYPTVSFRWKIQDIIESADLTSKKGDDAPARVYVTFAYDSAQVSWWEMVKFEAVKLYYGEYPPIASLVYVWASHGEQGVIMESPYTSRVKIIVLESGAEKKGQWLSEKRNISADYRAAFASENVPMISGVAIMTDTDNTGGQAVAWYGDIVFF